MKDIEVKEVIICNLATRGKGEKRSPIRRILQVFEKSGELIAENDPSPETFSSFDLIHFADWASKNYPELKGKYSVQIVEYWLNTFDKISNEGN